MEVTCIDFSRPMVLVSLEDMGLKGNETKVECDQNNELNHRIQEVSGVLLYHIVTRLRMPTSSSAQAVAICPQAQPRVHAQRGNTVGMARMHEKKIKDQSCAARALPLRFI